MTRPMLSLIIPIYFEEKVIGEFFRRTQAVMAGLQPSMDYELIFVNDGSTDRSLPILLELQAREPCVKILNLSRNFGHQIAITAGLDHAAGDAIVIIDGDLQDPPEVIPRMLEKWREGYKVVFGVRARRKGENIFKLATAKVFYRIMENISDVKLPLDSGDFRLMDRDVAVALRNIREENRYIRGLVSWIGFKQFGLVYERDSRYAGETKFTLRKMVRFALDGITSFSERPLRAWSKLGLAIVMFALLAMVWLLIGKFLNPEQVVQGWTSVMLAVLFLGGVQLVSIGVLGEYVGRIYRETKDRPLYFLDGKHGFAKTQDRP